MDQNFFLGLPLTVASLWSILLIMIEASFQKASLTRQATVLGFVAILLSILVLPSEPGFAFSEMIRSGAFTNFSYVIFVLSGLLVVLLSDRYLSEQNINYGEYYIVLFMSVIGMMLMGAAANLTILFIGLELMSISLYVLAGIMRKDMRSNEAALKYFLLGSFASGFFLYGIALMYGATGELGLHRMAAFFQTHEPSMMFWIGLVLLMIGFLFKVSAVPFHQWTPDVYEGAPTTATAFMSTGAKAAAFSAVIVVVTNISDVLSQNPHWRMALAIIAVLTMIVGNVTALSQPNLKRMLAYSSIAHAGYMLVGIATQSSMGYSGVLYYALVYTLMNIGAFGVIAHLEQYRKAANASDYAGLFKTHPLLAGLMGIFMFSLAGLPPFGGFIGKYKVFAAAVAADMTWLAVVGVLASVVSVFYYLRVVIFMFMMEPEAEMNLRKPVGSPVLVAIALVIFLLGIFPTKILEFADHAITVALR